LKGVLEWKDSPFINQKEREAEKEKQKENEKKQSGVTALSLFIPTLRDSLSLCFSGPKV
jgi:hypothetical protein